MVNNYQSITLVSILKIIDIPSSGLKISYGTTLVTDIGPIIFSLYINITYSTWHVRLPLSVSRIFNESNRESLKRIVWKIIFSAIFKLWKLTISHDKLTITLHNNTKEITREDDIKYLDVTIDLQLRWDEHIKHVSKSLQVLLFEFK